MSPILKEQTESRVKVLGNILLVMQNVFKLTTDTERSKVTFTAQKMFSVNVTHLLKKSLMQKLIFCALIVPVFLV